MGHWVELDRKVHHGKPAPTGLEQVTVKSIQTRSIGHDAEPSGRFNYCLSFGQEYGYEGGVLKVHEVTDGLSHDKIS